MLLVYSKEQKSLILVMNLTRRRYRAAIPEGASLPFPIVFEPFKEHIEKHKQTDLYPGYYEKLTDKDENVRKVKRKKMWMIVA